MLPADTRSRSAGVSVVRASNDAAARVGLAERFTLWSGSNKAVRRTRQVFPLVASTVGLWLCFRFFSGLDWHAFAHDVRHAGVGVALLLLAPIVGNFVHMLGWRGLLPASARLSLWRSLAVFLAAQAGNEVGFGVLGESLKVSEFPSQHRAAAWRAVLLDNLTALLALLAVVLSIVAFLGSAARMPVWSPSLAFGVLALLGCSGLLGLGAWGYNVDAAPDRVLLAFLAHYLGKLWIVAEFALALGLLGNVTLRSSAVLGLVSTLASAVGAAIPGQLGVLEAALKGSAATCGIGACTLVSVALLRRVRSLLWVVLGALLFWQLRAEREPARV